MVSPGSDVAHFWATVPTASTRVRNIDSPCRFVRRPHPQKGAAVPEQSVTAPAHGGSRFTAFADVVRAAAPI